MKAFIFASGLGTRMRPLTHHRPKPLLPVAGTPLIAWHLYKLATIGVHEVIINISWLADAFAQTLADGQTFGVRISYIDEGPTPLETGGGLLNARSKLGSSPFLVINGDIWTDYDFSRLPSQPKDLAHLVLVNPPPYAPLGDWSLRRDGQLALDATPQLTYAGIGVYDPRLLDFWQDAFAHHEATVSWVDGKPQFRLAPLLKYLIQAGRIHGEHYRGRWADVGTPERLAALDQELRAAGICAGEQ